MTVPPDRIIRIDEDAWAMRSLHPLAAQKQVETERVEAEAASLRNRAPDGAGWTELHRIAPPEIDFAAVDLDRSELELALSPLMPRVQRFYATAGAGLDRSTRDPYGSYDDNAVCFGFDEECYLKLELKDERIVAIWFECWTSDHGKRNGLLSALRAIDALTPCVLADYWLKVGGKIGDSAFLDHYAVLLRRAAVPV